MVIKNVPCGIMRKLAWCLSGLCAIAAPLCAESLNGVPAESASIRSNDEKLLQQADSYFDAALYSRAASLYQQILDDNADSSWQPSVRRKIAHTYFLSEDYENVIALGYHDKDEPELLYLRGLAYNKLGQQEQTVKAMQLYLGQANALYVDEAQWELGKAYFILGRMGEAKDLFVPLSVHAHQARVVNLSKIYLARIAIVEKDFDTAQQILFKMDEDLAADDPLRFEAAFYLGEAAFQKRDFLVSSRYFEKAVPQKFPVTAEWYGEALYHLGWSYMKLAEDPALRPEDQLGYFEKSEASLQKLLDYAPDERTLIALGQCYLSRARRFNENAAFQKAEALFSKQDSFVSQEGRAHALLLLAEAAPDYSRRDALYRHLTQEANERTATYSKAWYLRGLNDLEEGKQLVRQGKGEDAHHSFGRAESSFQKSFNLLKGVENELAGFSLIYRAQALAWQETAEKYHQALSALDTLIQSKDILMSLRHPDEVYYLYGLISARLAEMSPDILDVHPDKVLKEGLERFPKGQYASAQWSLLGTLYYRQKNFALAEKAFTYLASQYPETSEAGEALFWASRCAEQRQDATACKEYQRQVYERYPQCKYAPEAFFSFYTYRDYLQGDRAAIKHLQELADRYPDSPFVIHSFYLNGLDFKRDRKTAAGKWIRKKNLIAAVEAFQEVGRVFDRLYDKGLLPEKDLGQLTMVRYRADLESALNNLAIAEESQGAKQQIYLEYAADALQNIINDCQDSQHPLCQHISALQPRMHLEEESSYWLAHTLIRLDKDDEAEDILNQMLEKYRSAKITRGYFLSRAWYEKGLIALKKKDPASALQNFQSAEEVAKGSGLCIDEKLDLWIQQSHCHQALHDIDNAILTLSRVVNDDSISSLRVKAMYLRAEAYEQQGRRELARKQLEATAKKGGEWSLKAKDKLDKQYGYQ